MSQPLLTEDSIHEKLKSSQLLTNEDLKGIKSREDLRKRLKERNRLISKLEFNIDYEDQLEKLQIELVKLQTWIKEQKLRVAIIFEGRDAAGKGGSIKRFSEHLNPRSMRVVALSRPSDLEKRQWYFRRYISDLPNAGEIVFFEFFQDCFV